MVASLGITGGGIAPIGGPVMEVAVSMAVMKPHLIRAFDELILTDAGMQCSDWFGLDWIVIGFGLD